jgi:hypothetical protein
MKFLTLPSNTCYMKVLELYQPTLPLHPTGFIKDFTAGNPERKKEKGSPVISRPKNYFIPEKDEPGEVPRMELPVNNFLKTGEEIEAEFLFTMSSYKASLSKKENESDTYGRIAKKVESYSNVYNLYPFLCEPMEENY